jgi:glycogen debranching enzyme
MDAKVGDWVVTPRRGKAVEINALWYNALCLMVEWLHEFDRREAANVLLGEAQRVRESFRKRFWYEKGSYLYDVVDGENGDDPTLRPNQLFALSLKYPVLDKDRWQEVVQVVKRKLLTPLGLRSLGPDEKDFKPKYDGDLRSRDAAYHQGTVWPWLLGPFIDAWLKTYPDDVEAVSDFLGAFDNHLGECALGSVSEIFDAEAPYAARGCVAQAWSVAEILRCYVKQKEAAARRSVATGVMS